MTMANHSDAEASSIRSTPTSPGTAQSCTNDPFSENTSSRQDHSSIDSTDATPTAPGDLIMSTSSVDSDSSTNRSPIISRPKLCFPPCKYALTNPNGNFAKDSSFHRPQGAGRSRYMTNREKAQSAQSSWTEHHRVADYTGSGPWGYTTEEGCNYSMVSTPDGATRTEFEPLESGPSSLSVQERCCEGSEYVDGGTLLKSMISIARDQALVLVSESIDATESIESAEAKEREIQGISTFTNLLQNWSAKELERTSSLPSYGTIDTADYNVGPPTENDDQLRFSIEMSKQGYATYVKPKLYSKRGTEVTWSQKESSIPSIRVPGNDWKAIQTATTNMPEYNPVPKKRASRHRSLH